MRNVGVTSSIVTEQWAIRDRLALTYDLGIFNLIMEVDG